MLAIFGADRVEGDWLTAWSLLDLFLLLIFSLAVYRMYGVTAGIIALIAFGLAYHELGAPRFTWFLSADSARAAACRWRRSRRKGTSVGQGIGHRDPVVRVGPVCCQAVASCDLSATGNGGIQLWSRSLFDWSRPGYSSYDGCPARVASRSASEAAATAAKTARLAGRSQSNLLFDPTSRIQTGPAQPTWDWNDVVCIWNGPVTAQDSDSADVHFAGAAPVLTVVRVALLIWLAVILIRGGKLSLPWRRPKAAVAAVILLSSPAGNRIGTAARSGSVGFVAATFAADAGRVSQRGGDSLGQSGSQWQPDRDPIADSRGDRCGSAATGQDPGVVADEGHD